MIEACLIQEYRGHWIQRLGSFFLNWLRTALHSKEVTLQLKCHKNEHQNTPKHTNFHKFLTVTNVTKQLLRCVHIDRLHTEYTVILRTKLACLPGNFSIFSTEYSIQNSSLLYLFADRW